MDFDSPIAFPAVITPDLTNSVVRVNKIGSDTYTMGNNTNWKNPVTLNTIDDVELSGSFINTYDILSTSSSTYGYGFFTSVYENTMAVGELGTGGSTLGKVWVYEKVDNSWVLQDILSNNSVKTVATLFIYGNHIAVEDYILEKIWVYKKTAGVWSLQQEIMNNVATFSMAMGEGVIAIAGSPHLDGEYTNVGVHIYREVGNTWIHEQTITPVGTVISIRVSLYAETLVVGYIYDTIDLDSYIYERISGTWTQQQYIPNYGHIVSVYENTSVMSSLTDTVIYKKDDGTWTQGQVIVGQRGRVSVYNNTLVAGGQSTNNITYYKRDTENDEFVLEKEFSPSEMSGFLPGISLQIYENNVACSYRVGQFTFSFPDDITFLFVLGESALVFYSYNFDDPTRILVCNQTNSVENGIYFTNGSDWERSEDMPSGSQCAGIMVYSRKYDNMYYCNQLGIVGTDEIPFSRITFTEGSSIEGSIQYFKNNSIVGSRYILADGSDILLGGKNEATNLTSPKIVMNELTPGTSNRTTGNYITGYYVPRSGSINYYANILLINSNHMTTGNTSGTSNVSDYNSSFVFNDTVETTLGTDVTLNNVLITSTVMVLPKVNVIINSGYTVVMNAKQGSILINNSDVIASYGNVSYTMTNNLINTDSVVIYSIGGTSVTGIPCVTFAVSNGSAVINISNIHPVTSYDTQGTKILFVVL